MMDIYPPRITFDEDGDFYVEWIKKDNSERFGFGSDSTTGKLFWTYIDKDNNGYQGYLENGERFESVMGGVIFHDVKVSAKTGRGDE